MKTNETTTRHMLIISVCIFGTIGILRRYIPLSSSLIALVRGVIGSAFLIAVVTIRKSRLNWGIIRRNLIPLALSGAAIGFNWILLFEAYNYTSVAIATLCYYLAPMIVILAAPFLLGEKLTIRKEVCAAVALFGMFLVSGVTDAGFTGGEELRGIGLGLGAAVLYACVILLNKKMPDVPAYDKTILQLSLASLALLPYVLMTEDLSAVPFTTLSVVLLLIAGIVHTGFAYWLYFGSMAGLQANTVALLSYIDPVLAIILSMVILNEPMTIASGIGAVLILGSAYISEK